jgi:hypothetical protein
VPLKLGHVGSAGCKSGRPAEADATQRRECADRRRSRTRHEGGLRNLCRANKTSREECPEQEQCKATTSSTRTGNTSRHNKSRGRGRSHASVTRRMQHIQPLKSGHDDNMIRDPVRESALDRGRKSEYRIDARAGSRNKVGQALIRSGSSPLPYHRQRAAREQGESL